MLAITQVCDLVWTPRCSITVSRVPAADIDITAGAGTSDVTLEGIDVASVGFLNGTYQQFDHNTTFPWGLQMGSDDNYAGMCLDFHCQGKMAD